MLLRIEDKLKDKKQSLDITTDIGRFSTLFDILIEIDRKEMRINGYQISKSANESRKGLLQKNALGRHEKGDPRAKIKS